MKRFKILGVTVLIAALLSMCSACRREITLDLSLETTVVDGAVQMELPPAELLQRIEADYRKAEKKQPGGDMNYYITNYYGYYNGAVPVFLDGDEALYFQVEVTDTVAGCVFEYSEENRIKVWKSGKFYSLKAAYEKGVLTEEQIQTLHRVYVDDSEKIDHGFALYNRVRRYGTGLNSFAEWNLKRVYKKKTGFPLSLFDVEKEQWSEYCFGNYNGCVVIFSPGDLPVEDSYTVAGVTFTHSNNINLYGYYRGTLYSLDQAYKKGYITREEIASAKKRYDTLQQFISWRSRNE